MVVTLTSPSEFGDRATGPPAIHSLKASIAIAHIHSGSTGVSSHTTLRTIVLDFPVRAHSRAERMYGRNCRFVSTRFGGHGKVDQGQMGMCRFVD